MGLVLFNFTVTSWYLRVQTEENRENNCAKIQDVSPEY